MKTYAKEIRDGVDALSPEGLRVFQLTHDPAVPCAHVYMEAQVFSPDSRLFLFERNGRAHGPTPNDPEHRYMLCDLGDGGRSWPVTHEVNATGIAFNPDGRHIYYFIDNPGMPDRNVELKRVCPDGTGRETVAVIGPETGQDFRLRFLCPHSTISSDGGRLATGACVIDRKTGSETWGVVVFDLAAGSVSPVWMREDLGNGHIQYCRSTDPELAHDLLVQQNHGYRWDTRTRAELTRDLDPLRTDIHVLRDDGTNLRSMPWGRDGREFCQGHQCWRGNTPWAITSTQTYIPNRARAERQEAQLIEGVSIAERGDAGARTPGGRRNDLSRDFPNPQFHHFGTDLAGTRLISDYWTPHRAEQVYLLELGEPGRDAATRAHYLCNSGTEFQLSGTGSADQRKANQSHPFLSPDGKRAFFNSNRSGTLQIYMVENLP